MSSASSSEGNTVPYPSSLQSPNPLRGRWLEPLVSLEEVKRKKADSEQSAWRQVVRRARKANTVSQPANQPTQMPSEGQGKAPLQEVDYRTKVRPDTILIRLATGKLFAEVLGQILYKGVE